LVEGSLVAGHSFFFQLASADRQAWLQTLLDHRKYLCKVTFEQLEIIPTCSESLLSDIPAEDGNFANLFYSVVPVFLVCFCSQELAKLSIPPSTLINNPTGKSLKYAQEHIAEPVGMIK
jgi:hypothetical protein